MSATEGATARTRTRVRQMDVASATPQPTKEMISKAEAAYRANQEKNKGTREEKKALTDLHALMQQGGVPSFDMTVDGKALGVAIEASEKTYVDLLALSKMAGVKTDELLALCSIPLEAVKEKWGTTVLMQVQRTKTGEPSPKIKAK